MVNLYYLAQAATTSPDEKLVNSFNAFVSAINTIIAGIGLIATVLSLIVAIGVPLLLWNFWRNLRQQTEERVTGAIVQAEQSVDREIAKIERVVKEQVRLQVETLRQRTRYLENLLAREAIVEETTVDYFAPESLAGMPEGYQMLAGRGFKMQFVRDLTQQLHGDIVVLDLTHSQNLEDLRLQQSIEAVTQQMVQPDEAVLVVYVRGQFPSIRVESDRRRGFTSANFLIPFVGTVVNSAYVVRALKGRRN
jgi:membrane protein implicated in regulation of membrane protease activity